MAQILKIPFNSPSKCEEILLSTADPLLKRTSVEKLDGDWTSTRLTRTLRMAKDFSNYTFQKGRISTSIKLTYGTSFDKDDDSLAHEKTAEKEILGVQIIAEEAVRAKAATEVESAVER